MDLAIRVSRKYDDVIDWVEAIDCDKIIVFQHDADEEVKRDHIHMLVLGSKCKPDALKTRFKKAYGAIEKTDWSFKTADAEYEKYITYMTKGILVPSYMKGFDALEILNLAQKWVEPTAKNLVKLENGRFVRNPDEPGKKTKRQMLESMRSRFESGSTTREILKVIRKVLIENNEVVGMYKIMDYYDSLLMYSDKEAWLDMVSTKINSRTRI